MTDTDWRSRVQTALGSPTLRVAGLFVLLTVALTYPLSVHPWSTTFPGSSDRNLYAWTLAWDAHALIHQPLHIFDANIFHPYARTLAYSENLIGAALLVAPVEWLTHDPFFAFNLAALMTVPLCALGAFLLARRLGLDVSSAWVCGLIFGFAPPRFLRIDQMHLTAVEWIPFCLAYAHTYASTGRARDLRLALVFLSLQMLSSGHGAVFLLSALAGLIAYSLATGGRLRPLPFLRDAGVPGLLTMLPAAALVVPYRLVQLEVGLRRDLTDWTGSWASFLSSPTHLHAFLLEHLGNLNTWVNANTQAYFFPGILPLVLAAAAFVRGSQGRDHAGQDRGWRLATHVVEAAGLIALVCALYVQVSGVTRLELAGLTLSLRHPWRIWLVAIVLACVRTALARIVPVAISTRVASLTRRRLLLHDDLRVYYLLIAIACVLLAIGPPSGPWRYLYWLPGLSFIRVPSRFMILGTLGIAVLSAYGFARLVGRASPSVRRAATLVVTLGLVAEFAVVPFEVVASPREIPMADRWLASQPTPFVVAELPAMDPTIPMLHATVHWQKTVHGYSGWNPAISQALAAALPSIPDAASLDALAAVGVTYLVVHSSMYTPQDWQALEPKLASARDRLVLRYSDDDGRVYALVPSPAPEQDRNR